METILNFLVDNYLWFLIISLILIFGLIGYIVDSHEKKTPKLHFSDEEELESDSLNTEDKSLKELLEENDKVESVAISNDVEDSETIPVVIESIDEPENNQSELPKE